MVRRRAIPQWWKISGGIALVALSLITLDWLVSTYEKNIITARQQARARIEKMAWFYLRADIDTVTYTAAKQYNIRLWLENVYPEQDLFLMIPQVRVFLQVGPQWQEVPVKEATTDPSLHAGSVIDIKQRITVDWTLADKAVKINYFELLKGYMHVQIQSTLFVSPEAQPQEYVIERNDYYYLHLKPIDASDEELRKMHHFPAAVPLFIPMPPH